MAWMGVTQDEENTVTDWKPLPGVLCEFIIHNSTHEITAITRTSHISFKAS